MTKIFRSFPDSVRILANNNQTLSLMLSVVV